MGFSQTEDVSPNLGSNSSFQGNAPQNSTYTTSFLYDIGAAIGQASNAGVVYFNNQFWVSKWNAADIHELSSSGSYISTFQIPGITGARSMTTDGTNIYIGTASSSIYVVDPTTKTLTSTISISTTSSAAARFCTYDPTLDSGSGGFWIGNFGSDIASVSMTGAELSVIPAATHGFTGMYGGAVYNSGSLHYLFVYHQGGANNDEITAFDLATNTVVDTYDFFANDSSGFGSTSSLAGGMFLSTDVVSGQSTLVGVSQATPSNLLFGIDVNTVLPAESFGKSNVVIYPNPAQNYLNISTLDNASINEVKVVNILGNEVLKLNAVVNGTIDISNLSQGTYFLTIKDENNRVTTSKFIKQ